MPVTLQAVVAGNSNVAAKWCENPGEAIVAIDNGDGTVTVAGEVATKYTVGKTFRLIGTDSGNDDGPYEVASRTESGGNTIIVTTVAPPYDDVTAAGYAQVHRVPVATDEVDINGLAMVQAGGALTLVSMIDSLSATLPGTFTLTNDDFTCDTVTDVALINASHKPATADNLATVTTTTYFTVTGNVAANYPAGMRFTVAGSKDSSNDGDKITNANATWNDPVTRIYASSLTAQTEETGTLERWVPILITVGVVGDGEGIYNSTSSVALTNSVGGMIEFVGDETNTGSGSGMSNDGTLIVGGIVTFSSGSSNYGSCVCESGGTVTFSISYNYGSCVCESGGIVTFSSGSSNSGSCVCESGGTVEFSSGYNYGFMGYYTDGTVTGISNAFAFGTERRTTHFTGSLTGSISILNDTAILNNTDIIVAAADVKDTVPRWTGATGEDVGTYDPAAAAVYPAEANVSTVETAYGPTGADYAGELDLSLYGLLTDYSDPGAANVATGNNYTYAGVVQTAAYPTTAATQTADALTLDAKKAYLLETQTVTFGVSAVTGTLPANKVLNTVTGGSAYGDASAAKVLANASAAGTAYGGTDAATVLTTATVAGSLNLTTHDATVASTALGTARTAIVSQQAHVEKNYAIAIDGMTAIEGGDRGTLDVTADNAAAIAARIHQNPYTLIP